MPPKRKETHPVSSPPGLKSPWNRQVPNSCPVLCRWRSNPLVLQYFGVVHLRERFLMANEQNNITKSLTRSESMKRAWARRKSQVVTEVGWFQKPVCLCGCGEQLVRHRNPERQRLFKPGHDARLKSVAAGVLAGEVPEHAIPEIARMLILIPFQDETNNATLSSWQDHEEPMSSWSHPLGRLCSKPRTSGNSGKPWRCCSQRS